MSVLPQFLGMREAHDEHRKLAQDLDLDETRSWEDCDACLAIAAWDELMRALEELTPQGSQFYREPEACIRHVRTRFEDMRRLLFRQAKWLRAAEASRT